MFMNKGFYYALGAACLNASVGVLSLASFANGLKTTHVAFYKCCAALFVLSCMVLANKQHRRDVIRLISHYQALAMMAFFGFFVLYFFESKAYDYHSVATVVFVLLGSSTITTFLLSYCLRLSTISRLNVVSMVCALLGLLCFTAQFSLTLDLGLVFTVLAGAGYGTFLVLNNRFNLPITGIPLLWWLTLFGTLYLVLPFVLNQPQWPGVSAWPSLLVLGVAPTIGGFYCTTKALFYANPLDVQLFELAEPMIATGLAFVFFQQALPSTYEIGGALFIFTAITLEFFNHRGRTL